ncbi:MAG TPA: AtpZ/AtpI family protein [Candidatus Saccharimonadales bacterium]|nr:AtpZ/AtpI family protein [Candidatus Saccharimonadales bacterium]
MVQLNGRSKDQVAHFSVLAISGEIGVKLALPLVVFMLAGIKLDKASGTTPLFMLMGIGLAMTASVIMIARMIARVNHLNDKES